MPEKFSPDPNAIKLVPYEFADAHNIVPLTFRHQMLFIAATQDPTQAGPTESFEDEPSVVDAINDLQSMLNVHVFVDIVTTQEEIRKMINAAYPLDDRLPSDDFSEMDSSEDGLPEPDEDEEVIDLTAYKEEDESETFALESPKENKDKIMTGREYSHLLIERTLEYLRTNGLGANATYQDVANYLNTSIETVEGVLENRVIFERKLWEQCAEKDGRSLPDFQKQLIRWMIDRETKREGPENESPES